MEYSYFVVGWDVLLMLDRMNKALRVYEQENDESKKQEMDRLFADCYDWLVNRGIPVYYDEKPKLWLLRLY
jgi:hypothetical protein